MIKSNNLWVILFQSIVLLIYVNGIFVIDFYLFDALPRILNALLTFFILPMVFAALMMYIGQAVFPVFTSHQVIETTNLPIFYSTILWLAILLFSYMGIKDYFKLTQFKNLKNTSLEQLSNESPNQLGYIILDNAQPVKAGKGVHYYTSKVKSGEIYNTVHHYYNTMPILSFQDRTQKTTNCWMCIYQTDEPADIPINLVGSPIHAMVIQDPYQMNYCKKAIQKAKEGYTIKQDEPLFLLKPTLPYSDLYQNKKSRTLWFFGIINLLFVGIPIFYMIKSTIDTKN